jgi:hypothetical protein
MDKLGDGLDVGLLDSKARAQGLEGAAIAFVREFGLEHVVAELRSDDTTVS